MQIDEKWMSDALALAERGRGFVHPNPMVGAVIVRQGTKVAEGYHRAYGKEHAEVEALVKAGSRARGATLYVTLEPCAHWGKTPPCVDLILRSGIREVVAAIRDPFPRVAGRGFARLRKAGVKVRVGLLAKEAQDLNRAFLTRVQKRRPFITLKIAATLDGKIATTKGESQWITGAQARHWGHRWRSAVDAIAVGVNTVIHDNPGLTSHGLGQNPRPVVFDSRLRMPLSVVLARKPSHLWIVTTSNGAIARRRQLEARGVRLFETKPGRNGRVNLAQAMRLLAGEGITHLLVEGGGELHAEFLRERLVDEILWFISPMIIGGQAAHPAIGGPGAVRLAEAWRLMPLSVTRVGEDLCIRTSLEK